MIKYVIIFICLIGASFYVPALRARVMPIFAPVLNHLGPVGDKLAGPSKRWAARNEANILLRKLAEEHAEHKDLPSPMNFQTWIKLNTRGGQKGLDPWNHPYYLVHNGSSVTVGSQGPDRLRNTSDDIRVSAPIN